MDILNIILNWAICAYFLCGIYLWLRRYEGDFSRRYLSLTWILAGVLLFLRLLSDELFPRSSGYSVLPVNNLMGGDFSDYNALFISCQSYKQRLV